MIIYTLGYAGRNLGDVVRLAADLEAVVVDVRLVPSSRAPGFGAIELASALAGRYTWLRGFGNLNYRGGAVSLADFEGAEAALRERLARGPANAILLCGCRDVEVCHRKVVAEALAAAWGCEVVHLGPPEREGNQSGGGRRGRAVPPSNRYRVTIIQRRDRETPFQLRIRDKLTGQITSEALYGLTARQKGRAYERAAERERAMNGGAPTSGPASWTEARAQGEATIEAEKQRATLAAYRKSLDAMTRYAEEVLTCRPGPNGKRLQFVEQITPVLARGFPGWRKAHGLTRNRKRVIPVCEATINCNVVHLHAFWGEYLAKLGLATSNPWHDIKPLRGFARQPVRLTYEQRAALLKEVEGLGLKFHAACALAAEAGPRVGELCHVTWAHIDTRAGAWLITQEAGGWRPKGVCERLVRFSAETGRLLEDWRSAQIADLVGWGLNGDDARAVVNAGRIFGTGRKPTPDNWERTFNRNLRRACRAVGLPEITCHGLRYTVGRLAADGGAAPTQIKDMLGHAAIQTTMHYIGQGQREGASAAFEAAKRTMCAKTMPHIVLTQYQERATDGVN